MYDLRTKGQPTAKIHVTNVEHTWVCIKVLNWYPKKRHMSTVHREEIVLIWNNCSSHIHHDKKQDSFIKDNILTNKQHHLPRNKKCTGTWRHVNVIASNMLFRKQETAKVSHTWFLIEFWITHRQESNVFRLWLIYGLLSPFDHLTWRWEFPCSSASKCPFQNLPRTDKCRHDFILFSWVSGEEVCWDLGMRKEPLSSGKLWKSRFSWR